MKLSYLVSKMMKKAYLPALRNSKINEKSKVSSGSHIVQSALNRYSYVGSYCTIINTEIGQFCSIADNCIIGGASHPINWVSSSPAFHHGKNILRQNFAKHEFNTTERTKIGNDVWIGNNCLIKSGVVISDGAVIGMGSVVTKNVGAYEIWAGNPARMIRKRFTDEMIDKLLNIQWWDFPEERLRNYGRYFNDPKGFIDSFERG